jgi:hypothetical protein
LTDAQAPPDLDAVSRASLRADAPVEEWAGYKLCGDSAEVVAILDNVYAYVSDKLVAMAGGTEVGQPAPPPFPPPHPGSESSSFMGTAAAAVDVLGGDVQLLEDRVPASETLPPTAWSTAQAFARTQQKTSGSSDTSLDSTSEHCWRSWASRTTPRMLSGCCIAAIPSEPREF